MAQDDRFTGIKSEEEEGIYVGLTYDDLDVVSIMNRVKNPKAGAVVMFAGAFSASTHSSVADSGR
jgi:molybdopterin synthase catalytic subunit